MRFEIVIDDEDRGQPGNAGTPWNAALFPIADDGESGELLAVGIGATPHEAVMALLEDAGEALKDKEEA
jgi:hypothetical protein